MLLSEVKVQTLSLTCLMLAVNCEQQVDLVCLTTAKSLRQSRTCSICCCWACQVFCTDSNSVPSVACCTCRHAHECQEMGLITPLNAQCCQLLPVYSGSCRQHTADGLGLQVQACCKANRSSKVLCLSASTTRSPAVTILGPVHSPPLIPSLHPTLS